MIDTRFPSPVNKSTGFIDSCEGPMYVMIWRFIACRGTVRPLCKVIHLSGIDLNTHCHVHMYWQPRGPSGLIYFCVEPRLERQALTEISSLSLHVFFGLGFSTALMNTLTKKLKHKKLKHVFPCPLWIFIYCLGSLFTLPAQLFLWSARGFYKMQRYSQNF